MSRQTPWGKAQSVYKIAPGITNYSCAGHGGYYVSKHVRAVMPPECVNEDGWYEEDAEWSKIAVSFPHLFPKHIEAARSMFERYFRKDKV